MFGLFSELGPFSIDDDMRLQKRPFSWSKPYHTLFVSGTSVFVLSCVAVKIVDGAISAQIDNPVGAGFSYTETDAGYATNSKDDVARNLVSLLHQFYQLFPERAESRLYVTGESYGGHYVPVSSDLRAACAFCCMFGV